VGALSGHPPARAPAGVRHLTFRREPATRTSRGLWGAAGLGAFGHGSRREVQTPALNESSRAGARALGRLAGPISRSANGSPAFSLPELRAQPQSGRRVDGSLADSLGLHLQPTSTPGRQCRRIPGNALQVVRFKLPTGGAVLSTRGQSAPLTLRRFGTFFTVQAGTLLPGEPMALRIPRDSAPDAWYASIPTSAVLACALPGGARTQVRSG
jgi:hypothetical protein